MAIAFICDECGAVIAMDQPNGFMFLQTGRVIINGVDNNLQSVCLCAEHQPRSWEGLPVPQWQPNNCQRVVFYWPGMMPYPVQP